MRVARYRLLLDLRLDFGRAGHIGDAQAVLMCLASSPRCDYGVAYARFRIFHIGQLVNRLSLTMPHLRRVLSATSQKQAQDQKRKQLFHLVFSLREIIAYICYVSSSCSRAFCPSFPRRRFNLLMKKKKSSLWGGKSDGPN